MPETKTNTLTTADILVNIGKNLRRTREKAGDNLEETARKIGTSKGTVGNYESGKNEIGVVTLIRFCTNYGVSYPDILDTILSVKEDFEKINYTKIFKDK
jgi:transcriptional regulator with XRE-family HTH domain